MEPAAGGAGFPSTLAEAAEQLPTASSGTGMAAVYPLSAAASAGLDISGPHHHAMRSVASMSHLVASPQQPPGSPQQHHMWAAGAGYSSQYVSASLPSARQWDLSAYLEPGPTAAASSAASYYRERASDQQETAAQEHDEPEQQQSPSRYGHVQQTSRA
jgi:hypothetical protein